MTLPAEIERKFERVLGLLLNHGYTETADLVRDIHDYCARPEAARTTEDAEARIYCLEDGLRPFAMQADSMYHLKDEDKVCGMYVAWFRYAASLMFPASHEDKK